MVGPGDSGQVGPRETEEKTGRKKMEGERICHRETAQVLREWDRGEAGDREDAEEEGDRATRGGRARDPGPDPDRVVVAAQAREKVVVIGGVERIADPKGKKEVCHARKRQDGPKGHGPDDRS